MAFKSTKGSGNIWDPRKDETGAKRTVATENDFIDGYYVSMKEGVGMHKSNVYSLRTTEGKDMEVWGSTVIDGEMEKIRLGTMIRIKWLGYQESKKGTKFDNFDILIDTDAPPMNVSTPSAPHAATGSTQTVNNNANPFAAKPAAQNQAPVNNTVAGASSFGADDLPF